MCEELVSKSPNEILIFSDQNFHDWSSLNDTIMGGASQAFCSFNSNGLTLSGEIVEEGGGFVSCRSPKIIPPIDLASFRGFKIEVEGEGRNLKFAVSCEDKISKFSKFFGSGLRWVATFPTLDQGITTIEIPFINLEPTIRAKKVDLEIPFHSSSVSQLQLLHSKFGRPGELNEQFRPGQINILLRSISAFS